MDYTSLTIFWALNQIKIKTKNGVRQILGMKINQIESLNENVNQENTFLWKKS